MKVLPCLAAGALAACTQADPYAGDEGKDDDGKADASALGVFVDAEFQGQLVTDSSWYDSQTIQDQLLYTVGQLNGMTAVDRIDHAVLSNVQKTTLATGQTQITYTAKLPVIWNKHNSVPA